jgi:hypothetical protein
MPQQLVGQPHAAFREASRQTYHGLNVLPSPPLRPHRHHPSQRWTHVYDAQFPGLQYTGFVHTDKSWRHRVSSPVMRPEKLAQQFMKAYRFRCKPLRSPRKIASSMLADIANARVHTSGSLRYKSMHLPGSQAAHSTIHPPCSSQSFSPSCP